MRVARASRTGRNTGSFTWGLVILIALAILPLQGRAAEKNDWPGAVTPTNASGTGSKFYTTDVHGMDSVNLTNGRVEIKIPFATLKGRNGLDVSLMATYSLYTLLLTSREGEQIRVTLL